MTATMSHPLPAPRLLLVEDDETLRRALAIQIEAAGWGVNVAAHAEPALRLAEEERHDLVLIDWNLPGMSGLELCARLRSAGAASPSVVMLTSRGAEEDVVAALEAGASDYIIKPFRSRELIARLRAQLRERGADGVLRLGALHIEVPARRVRVNGQEVHLTPVEFALLHRLASDPNRTHERASLLTGVLGVDHAGYARNIDCHVNRLRRKLEAAGLDPAPIRTVYGVGYQIETERSS